MADLKFSQLPVKSDAIGNMDNFILQERQSNGTFLNKLYNANTFRNFLNLVGTPVAWGQVGEGLVINSQGNALEWKDITDFIELDVTPQTIKKNKIVRVGTKFYVSLSEQNSISDASDFSDEDIWKEIAPLISDVENLTDTQRRVLDEFTVTTEDVRGEVPGEEITGLNFSFQYYGFDGTLHWFYDSSTSQIKAFNSQGQEQTSKRITNALITASISGFENSVDYNTVVEGYIYGITRGGQSYRINTNTKAIELGARLSDSNNSRDYFSGVVVANDTLYTFKWSWGFDSFLLHRIPIASFTSGSFTRVGLISDRTFRDGRGLNFYNNNFYFINNSGDNLRAYTTSFVKNSSADIPLDFTNTYNNYRRGARIVGNKLYLASNTDDNLKVLNLVPQTQTREVLGSLLVKLADNSIEKGKLSTTIQQLLDDVANNSRALSQFYGLSSFASIMARFFTENFPPASGYTITSAFGVSKVFSHYGDDTEYSATNTDGLVKDASISFTAGNNYATGFGDANTTNNLFLNVRLQRTIRTNVSYTVFGIRSNYSGTYEEYPLVRIRNGVLQYNSTGFRATQVWENVTDVNGNITYTNDNKAHLFFEVQKRSNGLWFVLVSKDGDSLPRQANDFTITNTSLTTDQVVKETVGATIYEAWIRDHYISHSAEALLESHNAQRGLGSFNVIPKTTEVKVLKFSERTQFERHQFNVSGDSSDTNINTAWSILAPTLAASSFVSKTGVVATKTAQGTEISLPDDWDDWYVIFKINLPIAIYSTTRETAGNKRVDPELHLEVYNTTTSSWTTFFRDNSYEIRNPAGADSFRWCSIKLDGISSPGRFSKRIRISLRARLQTGASGTLPLRIGYWNDGTNPQLAPWGRIAIEATKYPPAT